LALPDRKLVPEHENLDVPGTLASTASHQEVEDEAETTIAAGLAPSSQRPTGAALANTKRLLDAPRRAFRYTQGQKRLGGGRVSQRVAIRFATTVSVAA